MNIFKVLSRGDGSINEPNVSAFLAYLLDPKADHGLNDTFLGEFLYSVDCAIKNQNGCNESTGTGLEIIMPNAEDWDFSIHSEFDIEVFVEQAFKQKEKDKSSKRIIDIIILIYEKQTGNKSTKFESSVFLERKLLNIIFIENKIRNGAISKNQLLDTYKKFQSDMRWKRVVKNARKTFVYITPDHGGDASHIDRELVELIKKRTNISACHMIWNQEENDPSDVLDSNNPWGEGGSYQVSKILSYLISREARGLQDPINIYTLHTLKSFLSFIRNDFQSTSTRIKPTFKKDVETDYFLFKKKDLYKHLPARDDLNYVVEYLQKYSDKVQLQHSKTHPVSIFKKTKSGSNHGNKIIQLSRYSSGYMISIIRYPDGIKPMSEDHVLAGGHLRVKLPGNIIDRAMITSILDYYIGVMLDA